MSTDVIRVIYPAIAFAIALAAWIVVIVLVRLRRDIPLEKPIARMLLQLCVWLVAAFGFAETVLVVSTLILVVDPDPAHSLSFRITAGFVTQLFILVVVLASMWTLIRRNPARPRIARERL